MATTNPTSAKPTRPSISSPSPSTLDPARRLESLDAFRGLTIASMLLVNNPGSWAHVYPPLLHAPWHGWTPTDLIFPFFLFIVGVSMTLSLAKRSARGDSRVRLIAHALRRAAVLFLLGLLLHGFPAYDLTTLRIPGVLQRIALAYALAVPLFLYLRPRGRAIVGVAVLLGYWALLARVPLPDGSPPSLLAGEDLGAWIDRAVFGTAHLWSQSRTWDPEGLLSTLPAVVTVLAGTFAGDWLRTAVGRPGRAAAGLALAGAVGLALGLAWGRVFPINKNLWTSSYVVFTAGFACVLLAACLWLIDARGRRLWARPFVIYGTNAIAAFFLSSLFARVLTLARVGSGEEAVSLKAWLWTHVFAPLGPPRAASLAFALCYVMLWLGVMTVLHRRRIFLRI